MTCDAARGIARLTTASAGIAFVLIMGEAGSVQSTRPRARARIRPGTGLSSEVLHSGSGAGDEFELGIRKLEKAHTILNCATWDCVRASSARRASSNLHELVDNSGGEMRRSSPMSVDRGATHDPRTERSLRRGAMLISLVSEANGGCS